MNHDDIGLKGGEGKTSRDMHLSERMIGYGVGISVFSGAAWVLYQATMILWGNR